MKILYIHNRYQYRGGEDIILEQEVAMLRRHGHTVNVLLFDNEDFTSGSLPTKILSGFKTFYNADSARRVEKAIDTFTPDIIHIHNLFYTASPAVIHVAKQRRIPVVMTMHNYRLVCASGSLMRVNEIPCERCLTQTFPLDGIRFGCFRNSHLQTAQLTAITGLHKQIGTWRSLDRLIVLTDFIRQKIVNSSLRLSPEQVIVKPNAIADLGYDVSYTREHTLLYVGRLTIEKGIRVLLEAARLYSFPLEIIGDGPLRNEVQAAADTMSNVRYSGLLDREVVIERIRQCQALIVPSIWYEGLPTVIIEAFSTGTPVICSDQPNFRTIVEENKNGIFFTMGDADALANVIRQLKTNDLMAIGKAGRVSYQDQYTEQIVYKQHVAIYESLLAQLPLIKVGS
ncbi:glycosyltransferase family 1 protein [Fibrisoma montanum]|uniref:Glycosyltransferase family 1 protein n=1 Tax=Fibrisoma montanum TaxID=2305895 RepID=A0A418MAN2_9BACT|nr:glycosyltransferase family 4 protein [Fibrisoma montanum]RIV23424.1 glycosyltransferase family 1 protein [Fibrisoma montanum]